MRLKERNCERNVEETKGQGSQRSEWKHSEVPLSGSQAIRHFPEIETNARGCGEGGKPLLAVQ